MLARRSPKLLLVVLSAVLLTAAACGGESGGGEAAASVAVQEKVTVTPETTATPFALAKGTYRVTWTTTDCASITVALAGDNGFAKEKTSTLPKFSWIVTSVPDGTYTASQTDAACAAWELLIEKIG